MSIMEIPSLNQNITNDHISTPYPHLMLKSPSDALALVLTSLPQGDLPVLCEYKGACRQLASIRKSALCINHLSKVSKLQYVKAVNDRVDVKDVETIMEVLV